MNEPKVTILMATHDRVGMLKRSIESVFKQTLEEWELIVVNNGSAAETGTVLAEFKARDPRIIVIRNEKQNFLSEALDQGIAVARGKYFARLDDDDYWIDVDKLKKQSDFLDSHPDYVVVGGGVIVVDSEGKERTRYFKKETDAEIRKTTLFANPFSHTTVMLRGDAVRKVGGYGHERYCEDWDLWLRLGNVGKFYNFQEYFTGYTMHGANDSFVFQRRYSSKVLRLIKQHRNEYPGATKAHLLNIAQYIYGCLPQFIRRPLQTILTSWKRRSF